MSPNPDRNRRAEAALVLVACAAFTAWYAKGQLLYTLYFGYQLARVIFPQWLPPVGGSSG